VSPPRSRIEFPAKFHKPVVIDHVLLIAGTATTKGDERRFVTPSREGTRKREPPIDHAGDLFETVGSPRA